MWMDVKMPKTTAAVIPKASEGLYIQYRDSLMVFVEYIWHEAYVNSERLDAAG